MTEHHQDTNNKSSTISKNPSNGNTIWWVEEKNGRKQVTYGGRKSAGEFLSSKMFRHLKKGYKCTENTE